MTAKLKALWLAATAYLVGSRHSGDGSRLEARVRRLLIWLPLGGTAFLLLWTHGVREPRASYQLAKHQDLFQLEAAINAHRLRLSDQQYADLQVRLRDAELFVSPDAAATTRLLDQVMEQAATAGWSAAPTPEPVTSDLLAGLPGLLLTVHPLVLEHPGDTPSPADGLLDWLDRLTQHDRRIDVLALEVENDPAGAFRARVRLGVVQRSQQ